MCYGAKQRVSLSSREEENKNSLNSAKYFPIKTKKKDRDLSNLINPNRLLSKEIKQGNNGRK